VACGTCHKPAAGGADTRLALNPGFDRIFGTADDITGSPGIRALDADGSPVNDPLFGHTPQVTGRATPSFLTAMFADRLFWDGRAEDEFVDPLDASTVVIATGGALENQALGPLLSSVEMAQAGRTWQDVVDKLADVTPLALASNIPADMQDALQGGSTYPQLFAAAFADGEITPARIAMAIATYERTLVPNDTPWDQFVAGDANAMTSDQIAGWDLFRTQTPCGNCHRPPLFSDNNFRNIGLRPSAEDLGEFEVTGRNNDRGDFKTPSLRNVGLRRALMHVGWITDVSDAIDFYNAGTNATGHVQFTDDQSGIPNSNLEINEINVFGDDPVRRGQLIDFLVNGLTDARVAQERFPFDRPTLANEEVAVSSPVATTIAGINSDGTPTAAVFSGAVVGATPTAETESFFASEALALNARIEVDPVDVGQQADVFCVIVRNGRYFALTADGIYQPWNGDTATLPRLKSIAMLGLVENFAIAGGIGQMRGEFEVFFGYQSGSTALRYNSEPLRFIVE
jgi:cytochrome c peroxidase